MELDDALRDLAERQHALMARSQARALGASRADVLRRLRGPDWESASPRVLRLTGAPQTQRQDAMCAVLDAGPAAVLSHRSAAALWRLPGFDLRRLEVSRLRGLDGRQPVAATIHRPRSLPAHHVTVVDGIPCTSVARTIFDLAAVGVPAARLERLVDTVITRSPATTARLHQLMGELAARGRPGIAVMRAILDTRPVGAQVPASGLEARFEKLVAEAGAGPVERQVDVGGHEWVGRVDYLDRELGIIYEVDSVLHHTSVVDARNDRARDAALHRAGFASVVRIWEEAIWYRPAEVVDRIRAARRERLASCLPQA